MFFKCKVTCIIIIIIDIIVVIIIMIIIQDLFNGNSYIALQNTVNNSRQER